MTPWRNEFGSSIPLQQRRRKSRSVCSAASGFERLEWPFQTMTLCRADVGRQLMVKYMLSMLSIPEKMKKRKEMEEIDFERHV